MTKSMGQFLFWSPRILGVLFSLFVSIFALDVFGQGYGFWGTTVALLMHLVPVYILLIALAIGWRWEWAGALLFVSFSIWYVVENWFPGFVAASVIGILPIGLPPLVVGLLFLADWLARRNSHSASGTMP